MNLDMLAHWLTTDTGLPIMASLITGILIGLDREVMGKPAGLRTHALVALAATLLTLAGANQGLWTMNLVDDTQIVSDPTRMAHGILTGIGFLGAGVIFRQGPSVQGLTTAASLWITAALGVVYGVGMIELGLIGAVATLVVLVGLRLVFALLPHPSTFALNVVVRPNAALDAGALRALLDQHSIHTRPLDHEHDGDTNTLTLSTTVRAKTTEAAEGLARALQTHPDVAAFTMRRHDAEHGS